MNGAQSLVKTLLAGGVDVCFANPGTSEMHFVAALDEHPEMRCILGLHETVVTGAADGYARMADKPAATLLHLGPGLGNGLANLHNARRARSPMVNVVGEHALEHLVYNAPLTSDIEGIAKPVSDWVRTSVSAETVARDAADAIMAARKCPGQIATLILPADTAWNEASQIGKIAEPAAPGVPSDAAIDAAAKAMKSGVPTMLFLGDAALREDALLSAGKIAEGTGCALFAPISNKRIERGAGRYPINRIPYPILDSRNLVSEYGNAIMIGARDPAAFFKYPDRPSRVFPDEMNVIELADPSMDLAVVLEMLADAVGASSVQPKLNSLERPDVPGGRISPDKIAVLLAALMPDQAIISDETITTGRQFFPGTHNTAAHDWLQITGGAIGVGIPLATGAAIASPGRRVINLQADGSGLYSVQGLWTQARERLDVTTLIFANHSYAILQGEMTNVGVQNPGRSAMDMLSLDRPRIDWIHLANGFGVTGGRADTMEELCDLFVASLKEPGPFVIEVQV